MTFSDDLPETSLDKSEALDDDNLGDDYPPDHPLGVNRFGTTPLEEEAGDSVEGRAAREEPELSGADIDLRDADGDETELALDFDGEDVDSWRAANDDDNPYADDALDHEAPIPAEEAALHIDDGSAGR